VFRYIKQKREGNNTRKRALLKRLYLKLLIRILTAHFTEIKKYQK
jgi:hypothetical protein